MEALARDVLFHPQTSWWFTLPDVAHQVWLAHYRIPPNTATWMRPSAQPHRWEMYAQQPKGLQYTSTLIDGTASLLTAYQQSVEDMGSWSRSMECWQLEITSHGPIYDIHSPEDWYNLCVQHESRHISDDRLVPHWGEVSRHWGAVHLSFGGVLTTPHARYESDQGWTRFDTWDSEITYWLNDVGSRAEKIGHYYRR